ncbi:hypothetical protein [Maricaulis parjimensis]|uniref:hypothetical protein n=1 Tax=Maricaulis parjimensis TaxID=144023 RepID=UPI001939DB13|nr:hypothetical protein [Maricaulis parjimensis]
MILSRLSRAVRQQNWFAVALEFVIVVAGVLLAFQFSLMSQQQAERARVVAQIELVEAEMRINLERIRTNLETLETSNANLRELRVQLAEFNEETDTTRLDGLALYAFSHPELDVESFAIERLEGMDGRQLISGTELESALVEWRRFIRVLRDTEINIEAMIEQTNTGSKFEHLSIEAIVRAFPEIGLVEPVPVRFETDWRALSQDPEFADHLALFALNLEFLWLTNQWLETATQELLEAIDERGAE